ncbi:YbaY family lipoprotein [Pleomorphochaeta sp. DL1XJH-081]|jgi:uncharacterized lipoprotein YbaY|uniref:YbaY family lipoprotein n=1 Tax=Pleomorphochaeta sp. DL1XJH-081 TaxID=3409690 RepID=UPI003BB6B1BF
MVKHVLYILLLSLLFFSGCVSNQLSIAQPEPERIPYRIIAGTVLYPNNLYFPSRVHMEITLVATNLSNNQSVPIVKQSIRNPQRFPVNFILRYDPRDISPAYEYSVDVALFRETEETPYLKNFPFPLPELTGDDNLVVELQPVP